VPASSGNVDVDAAAMYRFMKHDALLDTDPREGFANLPILGVQVSLYVLHYLFFMCDMTGARHARIRLPHGWFTWSGTEQFARGALYVSDSMCLSLSFLHFLSHIQKTWMNVTI